MCLARCARYLSAAYTSLTEVLGSGAAPSGTVRTFWMCTTVAADMCYQSLRVAVPPAGPMERALTGAG